MPDHVEPAPRPEPPPSPKSVLRADARAAVARAREAAPSGDGPPPLPRDELPARRPQPRPVEVQLAEALGENGGRRAAQQLESAASAFAADRFVEARQILRPLVDKAPAVAELRELYGLTLYRLGRWRDAARELEAFRDLSGTAEQNAVLADCYRALGRWRDVEVLWDELRSASPDAATVTEGRIVAASSLADRGRLQEAVRLLEDGWKAPSRPRAHHLRRAYALADLYERIGTLPRARELFSWVARHDPRFADVRDRVAALS